MTKLIKFKKWKNFDDEEKVKYTPLLSYPELLKKENESGHITSDQYDILKTWHEDPWAWGKKFNS